MTQHHQSQRAGATLPLVSGRLHAIVRKGHLTLVDAAGRRHEFGERSSDLRVTARLHDPRLPWKLAFSPSLALGEAYMDGRLTIDGGRLREFLEIITSNLGALDAHPLQIIRDKLSGVRLPWRQRNHKKRARANVAHHYDLSGALYDLFLDVDRQYSCAYFPTGTESIEEAQAAKKRHLAAKLLLRPGHRVLDIGSGWGGLALELASSAGVRVHGITLSEEQLTAALARARAAGLARRVSFELLDYRDVDQRYDRIVSVGMFEHVGREHYPQYFSTVAGALKSDGVAIIHSIGRRSPPGGIDPWISKYIFPGGYVPALSEVMAAVERSGLWATDIEILRLHYADTLKYWYDRFQRKRQQAGALYGERFCRMWEFYLATCEMLFRQGDLMVFQIQLAHRQDAVPLTRDYITDYERSCARLARTAPPPRSRRGCRVAAEAQKEDA
jgi:cyclopropane-fatty-acyl-phospholipid synthase